MLSTCKPKELDALCPLCPNLLEGDVLGLLMTVTEDFRVDGC